MFRFPAPNIYIKMHQSLVNTMRPHISPSDYLPAQSPKGQNIKSYPISKGLTRQLYLPLAALNYIQSDKRSSSFLGSRPLCQRIQPNKSDCVRVRSCLQRMGEIFNQLRRNRILRVSGLMARNIARAKFIGNILSLVRA